MKKIIHHIRRQPEKIRRHILHVIVSCFAVVLFFLWIYSLGTTLTSTDIKAKMNQGLKPFSILKDNITNGLSGTQESNLNTVQ
jgi:hypothetical protein